MKEEIILKVFKDKGLMKQVFDQVKRIHRVICYKLDYQTYYHSDIVYNYYTYQNGNNMYSNGHINLLKEKLKRNDSFLDGLPKIQFGMDEELVLLLFNRLNEQTDLSPNTARVLCKFTLPTFIKLMDILETKYKIVPAQDLLLYSIIFDNKDIIKYLIDKYPNFKVPKDIIYNYIKDDAIIDEFNQIVRFLIDHTVCGEYDRHYLMPMYCSNEMIELLCGANSKPIKFNSFEGYPKLIEVIGQHCISKVDELVEKHKNVETDIPEQEIQDYWMWFDSALQRVIDTLVKYENCCTRLTQSLTDIKSMFNDVTGLNAKSLMVIIKTVFLLGYESKVGEFHLDCNLVRQLIKSHQMGVITHLYQLVKCVQLRNMLLDSVCEIGTLDQVKELVKLMNLDGDKTGKEKYAKLASYKAMDNASQNGKLDIVEFLVENRTEQCSKKAITKTTHPKVIEYLLTVKPIMFKYYSLQKALMFGDLDHFKWTVNYYNNHPLLDHLNPKPLVISYQLITKLYNQLKSDQIIEFYQYLIQQYLTLINYYHLFSEACKRGDIKVLKYLDQCHPDKIESPIRFKTTILDDAFLNGWNRELVDFIINNRKERFGKESWIALGESSLGIDEFELVSKHSPVEYIDDCIINCLKSGNIQLLNHIKSNFENGVDKIMEHIIVDNIKNVYPTIQFYLKHCQPSVEDIMKLVPSMIRDTKLCDYVDMIKPYLQQSPYRLTLADLYYLLSFNIFVMTEFVFNNQSILIIDQIIIKDITYLIKDNQLYDEFKQLLSTLSPHFNYNYKQTIKESYTIPLNNNNNDNKLSIKSTQSIKSVFKNRYLLSKILGYTNIDDQGYYVLPTPKDTKYSLPYLLKLSSDSKWLEYIIGNYSDQVHITKVDEYNSYDLADMTDNQVELLLSKYPLFNFVQNRHQKGHSKKILEQRYSNYIPSNRNQSGYDRHSEEEEEKEEPISRDSFHADKKPSFNDDQDEPIQGRSFQCGDLKKSIEGTLNRHNYCDIEYVQYIHYQYDYQLIGDEIIEDKYAFQYLYHNRSDLKVTEHSLVQVAEKFGYLPKQFGVPLTSMYNQVGSQELFLGLFVYGVEMPPIDQLFPMVNKWESVDLVQTFLLNLGFNCQDLYKSCPDQQLEMVPVIIDWIQSGNDKSGITITEFINDNEIDPDSSFADDINIIIVNGRMIGDNPITKLEDNSRSNSNSSSNLYSLSFMKWIVQHHPQLILSSWSKTAADQGDLELLKLIVSYDIKNEIGFDVSFIDKLIKRLDIRFKQIVDYIIDENLLYESESELEIYPQVYHIQKGIMEDNQLVRALLQSGNVKLIGEYLEKNHHLNSSIINLELKRFVKYIDRVSSLVFKAIIPYCNHIPRDKLINKYKVIKRPDLFTLLPPPPPSNSTNNVIEMEMGDDKKKKKEYILNLSFHTIICLQQYNLLEQHLPLSNLNVDFRNFGDKKKQILKSRYNIDVLDDVQGKNKPFKRRKEHRWNCGGGGFAKQLKKKRIINWIPN